MTKNEKNFEARIFWLSSSQGGRKGVIPFGDKYAPIIKITKPKIKMDKTWSLFVTNKKKINAYETMAEIKYLSDEAPNNLFIGVEFELYEGTKLVARGIVVS